MMRLGFLRGEVLPLAAKNYPVLCLALRRQRYHRQVRRTFQAPDPLFLVETVSQPPPRHPSLIRRVRVIPDGAAWTIDHYDCLPHVHPESHLAEHPRECVEGPLEQFQLRQGN